MQELINYQENLNKLRELMKKNGLKSYLIFNSDPHNSEEPEESFLNLRNIFSPYHAPAGTLLVTLDKSYIYTDGRFWIAASKALKDSPTILMKAGDKGVLLVEQFIKENNLLPLGFDHSLVPYSYLSTLKNYHIDSSVDLKISDLFLNDENKEVKKIFKLDSSLLSTTFDERINKVRDYLNYNDYDGFLVTALDEIAHILGYRGLDIPYSPVFYSYLYISKDEIHLFIDQKKLPNDFALKDKIKIHNYDDIFSFISKLDDEIAFDKNSANIKLVDSIKHKHPIFSPISEMKAIKGDVEIKNILKYHINDGYYVLKLMKYIEDNKNKELSEYDYAAYLDNLRLSDKNCFELSFETIASVDSNATMMHYAPTKDNYSMVKKENKLLLVDSGGQYYGATTDITRTFMISNPTDEIKHDYTLTLKSQIALSTSIFMDRSSGHTLDIKAREVMWKEGLDYKCGTGHGVGYILNVHEGPIGFRYYSRPGVFDTGLLLPGQVITVEPGVYKENKYGIRLENELLVRDHNVTSQGTFYKFETITYCSYDYRLIDITMLNDEELAWLNDYHKMVYDKLYPLVKEDEDKSLLNFLKEFTAELKR